MLPLIWVMAIDLLLDLLLTVLSTVFSLSTLTILIRECGLLVFAAAQLVQHEFLQFSSTFLYLLLMSYIAL